MSTKARTPAPGSRSARAHSIPRCPRSTDSNWRACPKLNSRNKVPIVEGAYTSSNRVFMPPERTTSTSSMLSAPAHIPPIRVASFGAGLADPDPHRTNVTVIATVGTGNGDGESVLPQLVAAQPLPSGRGYYWFAGEAGQSRAVRKYLRGQHHWDAAQFDILGYWRRDSEAWDKRTPRSRLISSRFTRRRSPTAKATSLRRKN